MFQGDITPLGLASALALVAIAMAVSWWRRLGLERRILWATVRAIVQLLIVGTALALVIHPDRPLIWSWLWVAAMTLYAGDVVRRRAPEIPHQLPLAAIAFVIAAVLTLGIVFGFAILPVEGRIVVPLAGMMVGNTMNAAVLTARRTVEELRDKRAEVEARLALGQPARTASHPYLAAALRTALIPQIETTKAVGLVFLPGAMTGLILAGIDPVDAVLVQAVVMFLVLGAVATTSAVIGIGLIRRLFTPDHRLLPLPRPADT
jgi:putative ABC transport system permease protein